MATQNAAPSRVCLFDLNGTLLDLSVLDPHFQDVFGSPDVRTAWFSQLTQLMLTDVALGAYTEFSLLAGAALEMVAARRGVALPASAAKDILAGMRRLPVFPDVPEALGRLQQAGVRLAALTQSSESAALEQVEHAKLAPYLEHVFSADTVHQLKPGPNPYVMAVAEMGAAPGETRLVAAHAWDIAGALHAGLQAAFVTRPDQAASPIGPQPDITGADLTEVASKIVGIPSSETPERTAP